MSEVLEFKKKPASCYVCLVRDGDNLYYEIEHSEGYNFYHPQDKDLEKEFTFLKNMLSFSGIKVFRLREDWLDWLKVNCTKENVRVFTDL